MNYLYGKPAWYREGRGRPSRLSYLLVGLIGAVLGGLLVSVAVPYVLPHVYGHVLPRPQDLAENPPENWPRLAPDADHPAASESVIVNVVQRVGPAVVGVINQARVVDYWTNKQYWQQQGAGSGVVISPDGYIVTNYHVVEGADRLSVTLEGDEEVPAEIVGQDPRTDLAVLKIDRTGLNYALFGDSDAVKVGQLAIAIGNPLGHYERSVTVGVVSGVRPAQYGASNSGRVFTLIQTDASINPGNSGGALLDSAGRVIGINTLKIADATVEGMGFAIPSNTAKNVAADLIQYGKVRRAWMGVTIIDQEGAAQLGIRIPEGLLVREAKGPAYAAGLRAGDVIVEMEGETVKTYKDLTLALESLKPGDTVSVTVLRRGEKRSFTITLGEEP